MPQVGTGATYEVGGDRWPCTIVRIQDGGARLAVSFDRICGAGIFVSRGVRPERWFTRRAGGIYLLEGRQFGVLHLGERRYALNPDLS